jgi:glycosidase
MPFATLPRPAVPETFSFYQIFVRNYTREGDFAAASARLGEAKRLGFDWIYLTPIHPIGKAARKGSLGSPYAIADYRAVNPEFGGLADFKAFAAAVHALGLKLMIDVVYNHSSPDSVLAMAHPEWFLRGADGRPGRKCEDWSDVVDFDFRSSPALWDELIDTLVQWRDLGVDGFRCDVASLVPAEFWIEARRRVNLADPKTGREAKPVVWLAESVHPGFLRSMRARGFGGVSESELHAAFDLSYDYDGWERLERCWAGTKPLSFYLDYLEVQAALYPENARKIRYLENHDQRRAAERFGRGDRLEAWTAAMQFLPGCSLAYMGQELAIEGRPSLFDADRVDWASGDAGFAGFFAACFAATQRAKAEAPEFAWLEPAAGVLLAERRGPGVRYRLLANLDGRNGPIELPEAIAGVNLLDGRTVELSGRIELPRGAVLTREAV